MSPYRESSRPNFIVGDRVRVTFSWWERIVRPSMVSSWHGHVGSVRRVFNYEDCCGVMGCTFAGQPGAGIELDVGCDISMPVRFLVRSPAPRNRTGNFPVSDNVRYRKN